MKYAILAAALLAAIPAFAQTQSSSGSVANVSPGQINSPIVEVNSAAPDRMRNDIHTNQAATAATVFVNPPAADTCAMAGSGLSVQAPGGGVGLSVGGEASVRCEMRADVINLKVTGAPAEVVKARQCMDDKMAEAYARAGMACVDWRPEPGPAAAARRGEPTDPYIRQRAGLPPL